ncbi:MAG: sodium:proton antiporter NhaD [Bacteroidales bacterium]|nr:sodium:proton antiporter NhaD [Bacteroidales bacterium]
MLVFIVAVFILGYACIALEHPLKVNKTASALLLGVILWTIYALSQSYFGSAMSTEEWRTALSGSLVHHLGSTAEIVFFLLGAMTIVTLVDEYEGFRIITQYVKTRNKKKLMWILSFITFFLSAVLDNMTTAIVMCALLRKLIADQKERWLFAGIIIVAANAGGAWSPIGDVTTIMLWIGGQVTTINIMVKTLIASLVCMIVPVAICASTLKGEVVMSDVKYGGVKIEKRWRNLIFFVGIGALVFVPVFKTITHLPPYLGMLFGVGILWILTEIISRKFSTENTGTLPTTTQTLEHIDTPTVLFFLGILMAVACLETCGALGLLANGLNGTFMGIKAGDEPIGFFIIDLIIGVLSSIIDNVPLVAAAMGMYPLGDGAMFATNHPFWEFLAYCAGTGGSLLIIGSAAGVAVMGIEKIDFIWYLKKISWLALVGYIAGAIVFIAMDITLFETIPWLRDLA